MSCGRGDAGTGNYLGLGAPLHFDVPGLHTAVLPFRKFWIYGHPQYDFIPSLASGFFNGAAEAMRCSTPAAIPVRHRCGPSRSAPPRRGGHGVLLHPYHPGGESPICLKHFGAYINQSAGASEGFVSLPGV